MVNTIIGIDPGINGSMGIITPGGIEVVRLPTFEEVHTTRTMRFLDAAKLHTILQKVLQASKATGTALKRPGDVLAGVVAENPTNGCSTPKRGRSGRSRGSSTPADSLEAGPPIVCYLEDVFSMPDDTPMTAFGLGNAKGRISAVLEVLGIPVVGVAPLTWKTKMGVTSDKKTSRRRCEGLYPGVRFRSVDDCEATLIATYGLLFGKHRA